MWVLLLCALATAQVCDDECSKILGSVNEERRLTGAKPVCINNLLMRAAMVQAVYQNSINTMTHTGAGGTNVGDRVTTQGYKWLAASENVAMGQTTAKSVMLGWMNSEGHRKNILNPDSSEMGIAHVGKFWAQAFGKPRPGTAACNVAVPGGSLGTLEPIVTDSGPTCDALCQSVLQSVNQKRAAMGELPLCINGKLQTAAADMARVRSLNRLQEEVDDTGFGTKGVGAAEHTITLSRGLPSDQNILDMFKKDYKGSGNGQNFTRGGIASDSRREFWVIIEAATFTPEDDKCMDTLGSVGGSVGLSNSFVASAPSFAGTTPSFAGTTPSFATTTPSTPSFASAPLSTQSPFSQSPMVPPAATDCSKFTSACMCTGVCGWSTSASACLTASATVFTDCNECSSQAKCRCPLFTTACQCATASGCGWKAGSQKCVAGSTTDCSECPTKAGCSSSGKQN